MGLVKDALLELFRAEPQSSLFNVLRTLDPSQNKELRTELISISAISRRAALCALDIFMDGTSTRSSIIQVLENAQHLFQPNDAYILQGVIRYLTASGSTESERTFAARFAEQELLDALSAIKSAFMSSVVPEELEKQQWLLAEIQKLPGRSDERKQKVSDYVKRILAQPASSFGEAMAMTAMLFGVDMQLDDNSDDDDDDDEIGAGDRKERDLKSINRRWLMRRWAGWIDFCESSSFPRGLQPTSYGILLKVEKSIIEQFPWGRSLDILIEIINRCVTMS